MNTLQTQKLIALSLALGAGLLALATPVKAIQDINPDVVQLLNVQFDSRPVAQIEAGDFHFAPGQTAPVHTHHAPAIGYVAKGRIIYQVEGRRPVILNEGDAFYEPAGPRILRFDNASATSEAIFIDYNFQQAGEPFIDFEVPPTENIDRRAFTTVPMAGQVMSNVYVNAVNIAAGGSLTPDRQGLLVAYVAEGSVELRLDGSTPQTFDAGDSIPLSKAPSEITFANASDRLRAKLITFTGY